MGKVYTHFRTKTAQNPYPNGTARNYIAYVREYPLPPPLHTHPRAHKHTTNSCCAIV